MKKLLRKIIVSAPIIFYSAFEAICVKDFRCRTCKKKISINDVYIICDVKPLLDDNKDLKPKGLRFCDDSCFMGFCIAAFKNITDSDE